MKRKTIALLLGMMMACSMTACGAKEEAPAASAAESTAEEAEAAAEEATEETAEAASDDANESINIYIGGGIFDSSMDPIKGFMSYAYPLVNEALLEVTPESTYKDALAEEWTVSDDALTYTFKLKEGIKFSDGSDFTSEDVVFTYQQVMDNPGLNENVDLTKVKSIEADGDYTVVVKMNEAYSPFIDTAAMLQIVPSDAYDSDAFDTAPIGTGAYKVAQYDPNQQIILQVNDQYRGDAPDIEQVNIISMDQDTAFSNAVSGQMDVVMVSSTYINEQVEGMTVQKLETMDVRNISLPMSEPHKDKDSQGNEYEVGNAVTSDIAVRQALAIGIDRQQIIDNAFNGEGIPSVNFTDNLPWANDVNYDDKRADEAVENLEKAGWKLNEKDGIREKDGLRCSFDLIAPGNDEDRYKLAAALAENAKELGIEINVRNESWDVAVDEENKTPIVWGWGQYSPTVIHSLYYSDMFLEAQYANVSGYNNPEVDKKIDVAIAATSQEEANALWKEAQQIGEQEFPYLFIVNIQHSYFVKDNLDISLDTQVPHPHGHGSPIICNLKDWTLN